MRILFKSIAILMAFSSLCQAEVTKKDWTINGQSIFYGRGNVGIGTYVPSEKLNVVGNIIATGSIGVGTANVTNNLVVSGNVGIGSASPQAKLVVASTGGEGTGFMAFNTASAWTSDHCASYPEGTVFWNATNHVICACNNASAGKRADGTTSCF